MANSMVHWNGDICCAFDIETTGLEPMIHEIWQLALIPLDSNFRRVKEILPFVLEMKPESPGIVQEDAIKMNRESYTRACVHGMSHDRGFDLLEAWIEKLPLPVTNYGRKKRIILLGHNIVQFDIPFLKRWLGMAQYDEWFAPHPRDSMLAAAYINDRCGMLAEDVPFKKLGLKWMCTTLGVSLTNHHSAAEDAWAAAQVYSQMTRRGLIYERMDLGKDEVDETE